VGAGLCRLLNMASSSSSAGVDHAAVRKELRDLKDNVEKNRGEYASSNSAGLGGVIDKANKLWTSGAKDDSRAGALDASLLNVTSGIGAEQAGNLDKATPEKLLSMLLLKYKFASGKAIKWGELARSVEEAGIYNHVPAATFLLGKFEPPAKKEKKERKRKETGPTEALQTADRVNVDALQENDEDKAQTSRMHVLANALADAASAAEKRGEPRRVNMFHLLLNPDSFSQTVENFFDLAFLVKDGYASMRVDGDCVFLADTKPPETDDFKGGLLKVQNILKLDHPTYTRLCERWCTADAPQLLRKRAAAEHDAPQPPREGNGKKKARM